MALPLSVLLVEDEPEDSESIKQELERSGFEPEITTAEIERDFFSQLEKDFQIIISEHSLRQFDALRGLQILKERDIKIPMVVVGDKVGEELAVESIKQGAADFVLRTRLNRLGQVVKRVLQEWKVQKERSQVESMLREDVKRYQQVLESCPVGISLVQANQITFVNRAGARLLGAASPKQIVGKTLMEFAHTDSKTAVEKIIQTTAESENLGIRQQERFVRLDGQELDLNLEVAPVKQNGSEGALVVLSESPQEEEDSDREVALFHSQLFTRLADPVVAVDRQERVTSWNRPAEQLYGLLAEEAVGKKITDIYQLRWTKPEDEKAYQQSLQQEGFWRGECLQIKPGGEEMMVNSTVSLLQDEEANSLGWIGITREITHHKRLEATLQKERNFYSSVLSAADALLVVFDAAGRIVLFNRACEQVSGYSLNEVRQKHIWDFLLEPEEAEKAKGLFQELRANQFPRHRESSWITKNAGHRTILWSENVLTDEKGGLTCVVSAGVDVTERRKEAEETQNKAQYFRSLIENLPEMMVVLEKNGLIRSSSPLLQEALGSGSGDLAGRNLLELVDPKDSDDLKRTLTDIQQKPGATLPVEFCIQTGEAPMVVQGVVKNLLADPAVEGLIATLGNVTERKKKEQEVQFHIRSMDSIHAIDLATVNSLDSQVTAKIVLEQVVGQLDADAACMLSFDPSSHSLRYLAGRGFGSLAITRAAVGLGEGGAGKCALERQPVLVSDLGDPGVTSPRDVLLAEEGFLSCWAMPLVARGALKGVLEVFSRSPLSPDNDRSSFLSSVAAQTALALDNTELISQLRQQNTEQGLSGTLAIEQLARALDTREQIKSGHSLRLAEATMKLGSAMGLEEAHLSQARRGALLHDIGKIFVPETILLKAGPLTDQEWEVVRQHPVSAQQLLSTIPGLRDCVVIPYAHHEKWDGSGYPRGLKEAEIPLEARVFSVVESWEVLGLDRPYRTAWTHSKVRKHLESQAGIDFDPQVVKTFLGLKKEGLV